MSLYDKGVQDTYEWIHETVTEWYALKIVDDRQYIALQNLVHELNIRAYYEFRREDEEPVDAVNEQEQLTHTDETMFKVQEALLRAGLTEKVMTDAISDMLNEGIRFREEVRSSFDDDSDFLILDAPLYLGS